MKKKNIFLVSVVVPVFNEEGNVNLVAKELISVLGGYDKFEVIFVDDGSTDGTLDSLRALNSKNKKIKYLSFSRNFGHQSALRAGLDYALGDCVITMDGDLQHPPALIPEMIKKWEEGYDIVNTVRKDSANTSFLKRKTANIFYCFLNFLSDVKLSKGAADFRLLDKSVVDVLRTIKENDLFLRGTISWLGFKQCGIQYEPNQRNSGKTKYTIKKMIKFATTGITAFSVKPLKISMLMGTIFALLSFAYGAYAVYLRIFTDKLVSGWASLITAVLFIGGIQMIFLGIIGEYIGRLFLESKRRPSYIIREKSDE